MASALSPDAVQSYMEQWVNLRYAFDWGHGLAPPSLMVHRNHQQDMVAGTDGSMDERTECMGAGYVQAPKQATCFIDDFNKLA